VTIHLCRGHAIKDFALIAAGILGSAVAVIHGVLTQRFMVAPINLLFKQDGHTAPAIRKLVPILLHMSTISWFLGGLALVAAALWFNDDVRLATAWFVGSLYLFGAVGNLWGTSGRHPGWVLLALAVGLIVVGAKPGR
jgi:hypothetical protein